MVDLGGAGEKSVKIKAYGIGMVCHIGWNLETVSGNEQQI